MADKFKRGSKTVDGDPRWRMRIQNGVRGSSFFRILQIYWTFCGNQQQFYHLKVVLSFPHFLFINTNQICLCTKNTWMLSQKIYIFKDSFSFPFKEKLLSFILCQHPPEFPLNQCKSHCKRYDWGDDEEIAKGNENIYLCA